MDGDRAPRDMYAVYSSSRKRDIMAALAVVLLIVVAVLMAPQGL